jgi:hypothetical protein
MHKCFLRRINKNDFFCKKYKYMLQGFFTKLVVRVTKEIGNHSITLCLFHPIAQQRIIYD